MVTMQSNNDISTLFRTFDSCSLVSQVWKRERGYLLADQIEVDSKGAVVVSGFLKGNCINANQLVHVTGLDDFHIEKIEVQTMGTKSRLPMEVEAAFDEMLQFSTHAEELNPFSKAETP